MGHRVSCAHRTLMKGSGSCRRIISTLSSSTRRCRKGKGVEILSKLHEEPASPEVVILADRGDPDEAERAIMNGAWEYRKRRRPCGSGDFLRPPSNIVERRPISPRRPQDRDISGYCGKQSADEILPGTAGHVAARSDASVLITGETERERSSLPGPFTTTAPEPIAHLWWWTAPPSRKHSWKALSWAMKRGRSPAPSETMTAWSSTPMGEPCSWMR